LDADLATVDLARQRDMRAARGARTALLDRADWALIAFGAFVAIFIMAITPVVDNDVFWHLATGRYIWATGHVPLTDPFSWTIPGHAWIAHEWLTEAWMYPLYVHGHDAALILVFACVITGAFAISYATARLLGATRLIGLGVMLLEALASRHTWADVGVAGVRAQMMSLLMAALVSWVLARATFGGSRRLLWVLPPLMVLWINLHGGFILGLLIVGAFAAGRTWELLWAWFVRAEHAPGGSLTEAWGRSRLSLRRWDGWKPLARVWGLLAACVAACLLNPNGLKGLIYPFTYFGNNALWNYIYEWASPDFHQQRFQYFEALLLLLVVGLAVSGRRPRAAEALLAVAFTYLALAAVRNTAVFAVVMGPLIAAYLSSGWARIRLRGQAGAANGDGTGVRLPNRTARRMPIPPAKVALYPAFAVVLAVSVIVAKGPELTDAYSLNVQAQRFPAGAVAYLNTHRPAGPLFNSYNWGGYLIWTLYPRLRVYVDGRTDMYGTDFITAFFSTLRADYGWQATLRSQGVRLVLVEPSTGLAQALANTPGWRLDYRDDHSVLYERASR